MVKKRKGEPMAPPAAEEPEREPEEEEEAEGTGEGEGEGEGEGQGDGQQEAAAAAPAQGAPPQIAAEHEAPVPDEWPVSAKARVKDEAEKRRTATKERDQWKGEAQRLSGELQRVAGAGLAPTNEDPLADVVDPQGLIAAKKQFWDMLEFAEENPDGADGVPIGQDAKGNEILMDYSRKDIVKMKLTAQRVLNEGIPAKEQYLVQVAENIKVAEQAYPELLAQEANEINVMADGILRNFPELKRDPEWILWLGDAIDGRRRRLAAKNGQPTPRTAGGKPLSKSAEAILGAPKFPVAPGVSKTRGAPPSSAGPARSVVDQLEKAKQAHIESGFSSETLEKLIRLKRQANAKATGGKTPALV